MAFWPILCNIISILWLVVIQIENELLPESFHLSFDLFYRFNVSTFNERKEQSREENKKEKKKYRNAQTKMCWFEWKASNTKIKMQFFVELHLSQLATIIIYVMLVVPTYFWHQLLLQGKRKYNKIDEIT